MAAVMDPVALEPAPVLAAAASVVFMAIAPAGEVFVEIGFMGMLFMDIGFMACIDTVSFFVEQGPVKWGERTHIIWQARPGRPLAGLQAMRQKQDLMDAI